MVRQTRDATAWVLLELDRAVGMSRCLKQSVTDEWGWQRFFGASTKHGRGFPQKLDTLFRLARLSHRWRPSERSRCEGVLIQTERAEGGARFVDLILNLVCHRRSLFVHLVVSRLTSVGGSMKSRVYPLTLVRVVRTT